MSMFVPQLAAWGKSYMRLQMRLKLMEYCLGYLHEIILYLTAVILNCGLRHAK